MASASSTNSNGPSHQQHALTRAEGGPALPIASAVVGVAGLACGYFVSWIACIALGIVATVLGVLAHRKRSTLLWIAKIGVVLGVGCILASFVLVAIVSFQMIRLGLA